MLLVSIIYYIGFFIYCILYGIQSNKQLNLINKVQKQRLKSDRYLYNSLWFNRINCVINWIDFYNMNIGIFKSSYIDILYYLYGLFKSFNIRDVFQLKTLQMILNCLTKSLYGYLFSLLGQLTQNLWNNEKSWVLPDCCMDNIYYICNCTYICSITHYICCTSTKYIVYIYDC